MSAEKIIAAAASPAGSTSATRLISLPAEVLEQSCKRVGIASLVFASLWAFGLLMVNVVGRFVDAAVLTPGMDPWPMPGNLIAATGLVLSIGMVFVAGWLHTRPNLLLDVGLGFEVVTAFLIGLLHMWVPPSEFTGVSWIAVVILVYPTIAPNTPGKIFTASLLAASMGPLALGVAVLRGADVSLAPLQATWLFVPNYLCAALAVVPVHIIRGLGRQVRRARDLGSYKLGDSLGKGGMGEVYHAEHRLLARPAAIKLIRPEILGASTTEAAHVVVERFKREAQAAAMLRSPHTIELYDFGVAEDGAFYYVMELLDGADFEKLVKRFGPVPPERTIHLVRQACLSLAEAHSRGLIHRDIKPSNIHTTRMGLTLDFVKVLDFGLVKADQSREQTMLTAPHMTTGTPAYMAPELAMGEPDIDGRVDLYALGCVFYWLLTGQLVFDAENPVKMMHRHISDTPEAPSLRTELDVPRELDELVLACLAKRPDNRPSSAEEVVRLLDAVRVPEPWTEERARRWWDTHLPEARPCPQCDKGELAPALTSA
ncbi:MAG: protein kinase [Gemmatimonadales bacterium]|nr:protein kinase [Gemmatimonadales bacterium]NIN12523.1 protein kinase [Gemmatimonadales bacterium]NIN50894.1 protein kinase [Gemmatimonadales bacterium]NIP08358.1 protein kinase [Gemmatimonadales bacterium]NIR03455.1 protein kinase [Gemmatimonadales bacterium]